MDTIYFIKWGRETRFSQDWLAQESGAVITFVFKTPAAVASASLANG